jgi:hypothetical protein
LLAKEILRKAYAEIDVDGDEKSSIHGEFGKIGNDQTKWLNYKSRIISWILNNRNEIERTVDALLTKGLVKQRIAFIHWVCEVESENGLIRKSQNVIDNDEISSDDISEKLAEGGMLPMFGMPTTVKNLYHGINNKFEPLLIDRDQAMAIYEFAPGAQKTKDKAIHTVIGFTSELSDKLSRHGSPNFEDSPFYINRWMTRCKTCGTFRTYSKEEDCRDRESACLDCGETDENYYQRPKLLKGPKAYRTNLAQGNDSKDDSLILLSRPPIFAETNNEEDNKTIFDRKRNANISISDREVTWRVNTNADQFFNGRRYNTINRFPFEVDTSYKFKGQWILNEFANRYSDNSGYSMEIFPLLDSQEESIALASNKKTEILRLSPASVQMALDLNMVSTEKQNNITYISAQSYGVRSGYYSAAFLLQRIIADKLDVDPTEIEIADIIRKQLNGDPDRFVAEIILTDELPNGSGFVRYLFDNFEEILLEAIKPPKDNEYLMQIHSDSHQKDCKASCYECLKVYRNMNYHSLLDWRLALSLLRIMHDETFVCGADGNFDFFELKDWRSNAKEMRRAFAESFGFRHLDEIRGLPIIKFGKNKQNIVLIVHPYWRIRIDDIRNDNWIDEIMTEIRIEAQSKGGKISVIDTFNLHRRPGWCYEKLISR